mgnify:CR=1 FL=1
MRVRISYGADIEDIPQELEQLFLFVSEKTHNTTRQVKQIHEFLADEEIEAAVSLMEKLRLGLAEIDNRIADVSNIASGYVNYKQNEGVEDVAEGRSDMDTGEERPTGGNPQQPTGNPHHAGT